MFRSRFRGAVAPLRRSFLFQAGGQARPDVDSLVAEQRPAEPVYCLRPRTVSHDARRFVQAFPGDTLYAVKCNPEPSVLRALWRGGVTHFDVASPAEVRLVSQVLPKATLHYMHPVKGREAIREAHGTHGVRHFAFDSVDELGKVVAETGRATDLQLSVRLAVPQGRVVHDLAGKFGASPAEAVDLLRRARRVAAGVGLSFHVGSQCLEPAAYRRAVGIAGEVAREAGVGLDLLDVGGGFPVAYDGMQPPPLEDYMAAVRAGVAQAGLPAAVRLAAEPGRALVAGGASLVVKVELRRGDDLYINDGTYGSLADAGTPGLRFPVRLVRPGREASARLRGFRFFGPTCDGADRMEGPFELPEDIAEGDWIEIGQLGAYGAALRTGFNGFDRVRLVEVADRPLEPRAALLRRLAA